MPAFEHAFRDLVLAQAAVAAAVGDRVAPLTQAQGQRTPFITYDVDDAEPLDHLTGTSAFSSVEVEVAVFARTYEKVRQVSQALRDAIGIWGGTVSGIKFAPVQFKSWSDITEGVRPGTDKPIHFRTMTFRALYRAA